MSDVVQTAGEPPTTAATPAGDPLARMTPAERAHWRLTGDLPTDPPASADADPSSDVDADSSTAVPAAQAVSTETSHPPASEPGTPKKKGADARKAELREEIDGLLRQRAELRAAIDAETRQRATRPTPEDVAPAASSPATEITLAQIVQTPNLDAPLLSDTAFFTQFPDASLGDYARYAARYEILTTQQASAREAVRQSRRQAFAAKMASVLQADPDFYRKQDQALVTAPLLDELLPGQTPGPLNYAATEIASATVPNKILEHLSAHPEERAALSQMLPVDVIRMIARLDARLSASVPSTPVAKATTSAPPPPTTLGSRASAPADEPRAAVVAGDFRRYKAAMNRGEVAS